VNAEELAWITQDRRGAEHDSSATPWRRLLTSRSVWAICAMYFAYGYGLYFYLTWLPTYLVTELGFSALGSGFFASLPFLLAGIADVTGGWLTDHLARRHSLRVARCGVGFTAFASTAALLFASTLSPSPTAKAVLLALALGSADLSLSACWAAPLDIAVDHAGVITGFMNTFGNLGGLLCPLVVGWAVERQHSWTLPFHITAVVYAAGAIAWLAIDPERRVSG
jgi:nitrate/nitrite transporter NarK